jgi:hypothetical protein
VVLVHDSLEFFWIRDFLGVLVRSLAETSLDYVWIVGW